MTVTPEYGLSMTDRTLVRTVADLFKILERAIQMKVDQLRKV